VYWNGYRKFQGNSVAGFSDMVGNFSPAGPDAGRPYCNLLYPEQQFSFTPSAVL
jgi:hypothetical protein